MRVLFAVKLTEPPTATQKVEDLCDRMDADLYVLHIAVPAMADLAGLGDSELMDVYDKESVQTGGEVDPSVERRTALHEFVRRSFNRPVKSMFYEGTDVSTGIADTIDRIGADILVIGHRPHALLGRMVSGNAIFKLTRSVEIPTLIIPIRSTD